MPLVNSGRSRLVNEDLCVKKRIVELFPGEYRNCHDKVFFGRPRHQFAKQMESLAFLEKKEFLHLISVFFKHFILCTARPF